MYKKAQSVNGIEDLEHSFKTIESIVFTSSTDMKQGQGYVPWHLFVHYRANGDSKRAYHLLKKEFKTEKSNRISTTGYLAFKDFFFRTLRTDDVGVPFVNRDLYQSYINFFSDIGCTDYYSQSTVIALL